MSKARQRITTLFDEGSFKELDSLVKSGENAASVITGYGHIGGYPCYAFSQDIELAGGAVGRFHAAKIKKLYDLAVKTGNPVIGIFDSNGAAVSEGAEALAAYGDLLAWSSTVSGVVPQISVVAGVCAGSAALLACMADYVIMSKDAQLFINPPSLSDVKGAGSAENAAKSGVVSLMCYSDIAAVKAARRIVNLLPSNNLTPVPMSQFNLPSTKLDADTDADTLVKAIADDESVIELNAQYGTSAYTALCTLSGVTVGIAATNKANSKLTADDSSKLARFVRGCDAFSIPVITFVDTEGFEPSSQEELSGSIRDMAKLAHSYAEATTVKLTVVTGKAYGSAYIILAGTNAGSDLTFAWEGAVITALAPEAAVEFMSHDKLKGAEDVDKKRAELAAEYVSEHCSAEQVAAKGYIERVISPAQTREALITALEITAGKRVSRMPKKHSNIPL